MKKLKKAAIIIAVMIMISSLTIPANAGEVSTVEFGTFQWNLYTHQPTPRDWVTAYAATSISSPGPGKTVFVTMDVQYNATGQHIDTCTDSDTVSASVSYTNDSREALAAFSCHEARGNTSIVRYMSCTF